MAESDAGTLDRRLGGIPEFYGAIWSETRAAATRWHLAIVVEIAMVVAWFAIRSTAGVDGRIYLAWVIVAGALALVAPLSGLVVFVASSVFYEPDPLPRALALREVVLMPLALGVLVRIAADRLRWRPSIAVWLAFLLLIGTALGVLYSFGRFPDETAWRAARSWFNNMAGPVILLIAAVWTARGGSMRVLIVACIVAVVSATAALAEYASPGLLSGGRFEWVGFWKDYGPRLAGTIPSPNALSAQLIVPTAALAAAVLLARDLRLKALALIGLVPLVVAHYLTFSRAPLLGAYVFAVVLTWRLRRWLGIAVLVAGVAAATFVLPRYLEFRAQAVGGGEALNGSILTASDQDRIVTWGTAVRMWSEAPLTGQGYLAYKTLAPDFGDRLLRLAPQRVAAPLRGGGDHRRVRRDRLRPRDGPVARPHPGLAGHGSARGLPRLRRGRVIQQPVPVHPGQRGRVPGDRRGAGACGARPRAGRGRRGRRGCGRRRCDGE